MEAGKTAVTGKHLLDENARVAGAKHVDQTVPGDSFGTHVGSALDGVHLGVGDALEDGLGLG